MYMATIEVQLDVGYIHRNNSMYICTLYISTILRIVFCMSNNKLNYERINISTPSFKGAQLFDVPLDILQSLPDNGLYLSRNMWPHDMLCF